WALYRELMPNLPEGPPVDDAIAGGRTAEMAAELARGVATLVTVWPALHAVLAVTGGWLAWTWYHRLASAPIGRAPGPFRQFSFSDHLVWLVIVAGAATLAPLPAGWTAVSGNLLLFLLALYAGRGLAVIQTALQPAPVGLAV